MPVSEYMPDVVVEIAFASTPDDTTPTWTDVSAYVEAASPLTVTRGRSDELTEVQPSRLTVTLDNSDGRFTPGNTSSPYHPDVKKNRQIRVTAEWPLGGSGTEYRRFTGFVDEWPVQWPDGTDGYSHVTVTASSRQARLAAGLELRSVIEEEYLLDDPTAYYPMGEPQPMSASPGRAGDVSVNQQPALEATGGGFITWQGATGPGTDDLSAPVFNGVRYLLATEGAYVEPTDTGFTLEAFVTNDGGTLQTAASLMWGDRFTFIGVYADGKAWASSGVTFLPVDYSIRSTADINDGEVHHLAVKETILGGNITATLYLDGVSVATSAPFSLIAGGIGDRRRLSVGANATPGDVAGFKWDGSISHVAVFDGGLGAPGAAADRIAAHAAAGLDGFEGDSSDERIERLARYADIPVGTVDTETGVSTSLGVQDTTGKTVIALMQEVTDTENGLLFDAGDGTLTFHARDHRYSAPSVVTLDAAEQHIEATFEAKLDGQQLVNDTTATGATGLSVRVTNADSITEHGIRRESLDLLTTDDNELLDAANWRVNRYGEPDVRISSAAVDLINQDPTLLADLLAVELGDRVTLDSLPDQAPAASYGGFVEGISESIGAESYTITFELSPDALSDVWQLNSATYSQLDETTVLAY